MTDLLPAVAKAAPESRAAKRNRDLAEQGLRWCSRCQSARPLTEFWARGRWCYCRTCSAQYAAERADREREQRRLARQARESEPDPAPAPAASPLGRLDLSRVRSDVDRAPAGLDRGSWPRHLQALDLEPVAVLGDDEVAAGHALADAALPLGRGWPAPGWPPLADRQATTSEASDAGGAS